MGADGFPGAGLRSRNESPTGSKAAHWEKFCRTVFKDLRCSKFKSAGARLGLRLQCLFFCYLKCQKWKVESGDLKHLKYS